MSSKYEKYFTVYAYICQNTDNKGIFGSSERYFLDVLDACLLEDN